jgi:hypothetical protein
VIRAARANPNATQEKPINHPIRGNEIESTLRSFNRMRIETTRPRPPQTQVMAHDAMMNWKPATVAVVKPKSVGVAETHVVGPPAAATQD